VGAQDIKPVTGKFKISGEGIMQGILWSILWVVLRSLLGVSKNMVSDALDFVAKAQDLKHDDGSVFSGEEKFEWVVDQMVNKYATSEEFKQIGKSTLNTLIELALSFLKFKIQ
jgi:hypothetical protein